MNILILGAGEIGFHLAQTLERDKHSVCVMDMDPKVLGEVSERLDVRVQPGNGATVTILEEAGVSECDLFLGLTSDDHTNLVAGSIAKALGAKKTAARVHGAIQREEWLFDYRSHFSIDYLFSPERLAAIDLAKFIRNPNALLVEEFARGKIELQQTVIATGSRAAGATLRTVGLPSHVRVGLIHRDGRAFVPNADNELRAGDVVTLFGAPSKLTALLPVFQNRGSEAAADKTVVIFGGGDYGYALAQMLESGPFRTRIFETDPVICEQLCHTLQRTSVINADATSLAQLKEEQVGDADFFVAATRDDEDNVMTCLQAKSLGAKHCVTLIHRADYADAISRNSMQLGVMGAVSPRVATAKDLMRLMTHKEVQVLVKFDGGVHAIEAHVPEGCAIAGREVREITWPPECGLVALLRGQTASVPGPEDRIQPGDDIVAIVSDRSRREMEKLLEP